MVIWLLAYYGRSYCLIVLASLLLPDYSIIDIRAMGSKTATTKFEVEKFDGKSNFLLWKIRVTTLLVEDGVHKALQGLEKALKMEWSDIDFYAKATIILCLPNEILYNVMNEEITAGLWCKA